MNNKKLIDEIYVKLILNCKEKCNVCKYIDDCTCMCGFELPKYIDKIDYKYLEETFNLESIAKSLDIEGDK